MTSPLSTPLARRFGLSAPVFGFAHDVATVAAITNAGGLGVYGATRRFPHEIRAELAEIRRLVGDKPFGVDLVLPPGMPEHNNRAEIEAHIPAEHTQFIQRMIEKYEIPEPSGPGMRTRFVRSSEIEAEQLAAVMESDVNLFACGIGAPKAEIERAHELGKATAALIGSPRHMKSALAAGVEIIVAQGTEAGAHTGKISTFSLLPQIVNLAGDIPVLAAGGVATGRHLAASLVMGAQGVWTGTMWLTCTEHAPHLGPTLVAKLLAARSDDTVVQRSESGKTMRMIRTSWTDEWSAPGAPEPLKMPYQDILVGDVLGAIEEHDIEPLVHSPAGQALGQLNELKPAAQLIDELVSGAEAALSGLS